MVPAATAEGEDVQTLRERIAELEQARRSDVTELQHAQEALANTQFESAQARRRVKELEERLEELEAVPAAAAEQVTASFVEEATSFSARLAHLVREHESAPEPEPGPGAEPEPAPQPAPPGPNKPRRGGWGAKTRREGVIPCHA